jgi:hypothetical protein
VKSIVFLQGEPTSARQAEDVEWSAIDAPPLRAAPVGAQGATRWQLIKGEPGTPPQAVDYLVDDRGPALPTRDVHRVDLHGFTCFVGEEIAADGPEVDLATVPYAFVLALTVPAEYATELEAWYSYEHAPLLLEEPTWLRSRRYRALPAERAAQVLGTGIAGYQQPPWTHLVVHDLSSLDALGSPADMRARATPWRARLATHDWHRSSRRWRYQRLRYFDILSHSS